MCLLFGLLLAIHSFQALTFQVILNLRVILGVNDVKVICVQLMFYDGVKGSLLKSDLFFIGRSQK